MNDHSASSLCRFPRARQLTRRVIGLSSLTPAQLGRLGEHFAADMLRSIGWSVIGTNYRTRFGEIDIVCRDTANRLSFVEVKTRRSDAFGPPESAVTPAKQRRIRLASLEWMRSHPLPHAGNRQPTAGKGPGQEGVPRARHNGYEPDSPRYDVVAVSIHGSIVRARLIEEAF